MAKITPKAFEPYWINSVFFYIGLQRDCPELLTELIDIEPTDDLRLGIKTFTLSDFLLAGYATPYHVIIRGVKQSALTLAQIFKTLVSGKADLGLEGMPAMQALWIVQYCFKHRYGYAFFEKAIPEAVQEVVLSDADKDVKAFAVFFLSVAYKELGGRDNFDFLLTDELQPLPLHINMALLSESANLKAKSKLFIRHEKHFRESMRRDPKLRKVTEDLFYRPLRLAEVAAGKDNGKQGK